MASEAEASCESDPNFAIICAFIEKFGEMCGIGSIDFVELQNMLENNQEVSPELMNLHIKLLRKTRKTVTVERWERTLVNMCHRYSSKDAWEIERFGYKKTRLQVKLRALKELLEMQFDYHTKFKNEVNKMSADSLRAQPLGRDKLGRAYWFQTDNSYQIRIYKEDPDEETWHLIAKDRDGLLSLINELADGDTKLSSDSALNEDSNSLSEKPFIDTGQSDNSNECKSDDKTEKTEVSKAAPQLVVSIEKLESVEKFAVSEDKDTKIEEKSKTDTKTSELKSETLEDEKIIEKPSMQTDEESSEQDVEEEDEQDDSERKEEESVEIKRPMLRIKSLSELMEKPKETRKTNLLPELPELTIIKKPKLDLPQITITRKPKMPQKDIHVSPAVESPVMIIRGEGSGSDNKSSNIIVSEEIEEPTMHITGDGLGNDCQTGNQEVVEVSEEVEEPVMYFSGYGTGYSCFAGNNSPKVEGEIIVSEEIEEEVMYFFGEGSGEDCQTGNEKAQSTTQQSEQSKSTEAATVQASKLDTTETPVKVPIDSVKLDTIIDSKTDNNEKQEENISPKKMQFFFGPGSLNIKPNPATTGSSDVPSSNPDDMGKNNSEEQHADNGDDGVTEKCSKEEKVPSLDCPDSEESVHADNKTKETSENESDKEQIEGEDKGETDETNCLDASKMEDEKIETTEIDEKPQDDKPTEETKTSDDSSSKKEDSNENDSAAKVESTSVHIEEKMEEKVDNDKDRSEECVDKNEENKDLGEHKEESSRNEDNEKTTILPETTENKSDEDNTPKQIKENLESQKDITETENNINKSEGNCTVIEEETNIIESKVEVDDKEIQNEKVENDNREVEKEKIMMSSEEGFEKSKIEEKNFSLDELKESEVETKKDEQEEKQVDKKNNKTVEDVDGKTDKALEVHDKTDDIVEKTNAINEEDTEPTKAVGTEMVPEELGQKAEVSVQLNDKKNENEKNDEVKEEKSDKSESMENTTDEKDEDIDSKTQDKKRKRATRNTSILNESVVEEEMNPRKKIPIEKTKKRGPQKAVTSKNIDEEEKEDQPTSVEVTGTRSTRQTRQTRTSATAAKAPSPPPLKAKGKLKKTVSQTSKSDDAESPAPLESVIIDTDNSSTAVENPETDPLAVSEEEMATINPTVPSITSFSFDYNPNSPVPEESKRGLRKRGRDNLDDKPEPSEKSVKRPKMKGKRSVDQSLRKSVEEKRQQVGDASSDENDVPKKEIKGKAGKKVTPVKKKVDTSSVSESDNASQKPKGRKKGAKGVRLLKNLGVKEEDISSLADSPAPVRQSRRLAQIKIKEEATRRRVDEDDESSKKKKKKSDDKDFKVGKRKRIEEEVKPAPTPPMVEKKRKKKTKQKKVSIGWKSSSEDSDNSAQEEEEVSEYEEHHEEEPLQFKSDHEFSPESDLEGDEPLPLKRARTVRKEESDDDGPEEEFPCQKCGKSDHPEWILLCDKCDNGWHCSCLRPALFVIPEGDWYCPSCQHEMLLKKLTEKLEEFDKLMVKKEMEDRRKERLAYVGISLNNVLPTKDKKERRTQKSSESERSSRENSPSGSDSEESDSDEPIYQLRQRRQAHSYKFQDYDDLINSALEEEPPPQVEKTHTLGRGKDIATIVNAAKEEEEKNGFEDLPPVVPRDPDESRKKAMSYRRKPKRLNNLEVNSDDEADDSDEDFKGSSSDESDEEEYTEDSDDSFVGKKSSRPTRRSTRARTTRFDADFINDDDSDDGSSRKKKKKRYFSDSESSVSDDWRGRKKKSNKSHKKSKKKKKVFDDSDLENYRKKKPKIKYGMDSEDDTKGRRTRGKKTSYLDTLGSDSEEETLKKKIKEKSDDEYVAEDDEEKESEEEPEIEKPSDSDDEDEDKEKKNKSEDSDSEEETLVVKKMKLKKKRAIMDSEDEDEEEEEEKEEVVEEPKERKKEEKVKPVKPPKPIIKPSAIDEELEKAAEEFRRVDKQILEEPKILPMPPMASVPQVVAVPVVPVSPSKDQLPALPLKELEKPAVLPGLNVDKLKACGITVTRVAKDKAGAPPSDEDSPTKLIEIGSRPIIPVLSQRNNSVTIPPVTLQKLEKNLDELDEDEVEEMMENEEYANRQLELAAIQIRQAKRLKELEVKPIPQQTPPAPPAISRKPVDIIPKKTGGGRFFNMKPSQESMLGNSSLVMNDDDNDELSEPPGVTLPLFSELGSMKVHNLSKTNNATRSLTDNTPPPPLSPNRAVPVPLHNMPMCTPHPNIPMVPPNSFNPRQTGMIHPMRQTRPMGHRGGNMSPMIGPRGPMMDPRGPMMDTNRPNMVPPMGMNPVRNMNIPPMSSSSSVMSNNIPMGTSAPIPMTVNTPTMGPMLSMATPAGLNMTMGSNVPMGPITHAGPAPGNCHSGQNVAGSHAPNVPSSINESPDGTPKKRRGRGKGKKTLAAEAAAAAAAAGLPSSEPTKTGNTKPPVANIEIASPPQPFSQSQPAPSVITRMLQTTPGKGAFPVGRIRPKQFAMMQDSDDNESPRPVETQEKDISSHPPPVSHPPVSGAHGTLQPNHYGPPPGQYPPNYYPKDGQPQPPHGYHHQRQAPPPMHSYPPHPSQSPIDPPPMNPPPPINQPPISMADSPAMGQYTAPPPPSKSPYESLPPHRPPYPNSNPVYNYDYNVPPSQPPVMGGEEVPPTSYENSSSYSDQYEAGSSNMDPSMKNVEEENGGEFGGLVSYFSSQHEDELEQ